MATALLFERDTVDELEDWQQRIPRLGRTSALWIDLEHPDRGELERVVELLELAGSTADSLTEPGSPHLRDHETYLEVAAYAPADAGSEDVSGVTCLVSERWVVTIHDRPLEVLERFRERACGSGETGRLDGPELLADILEWVLASYFDAFERIEVALEDIDSTAMRGEIERRDDALFELVEMRREIGRLRRALTSHRELILALARPELDAITSSAAADRFGELRERLEQAVQAARDGRDSVVASFDVLIASTGQRTNEIMKVLTLASVLLLPGALVAGILGMNFKVGLFEEASYFWVAIGGMVAIAVATLLVARVRHWV